MIVVTCEFIEGDGSVWLDFAQEALFGEDVEDVVDCLRGDRTEALGDTLTDSVCGGVRSSFELFEHRQPRARDAKASFA